MMPLSALLSQLEADETFVTNAMRELDRINSNLKVKSTYTRASGVDALLNHWLVERELDCYERGRIVEDVCAATVQDRDIGRGIDAIEDSWKIDLNSLVELLQSKNISVPACMIRFLGVGADGAANANQPVPGKMPRVAIGRLAVTAAWQIEHESNRAATADKVIERLQAWATDGQYPDILLRAEPKKRAVIWMTKNTGLEKAYDVDACGKTLSEWRKSRA